MIKNALVYLMENMSRANLVNVDGQQYADRKFFRIANNPKADPIEMETLSSLVDYIKSEFDTRAKVFVHVKSPTKVSVYSVLDDNREREHMVNVIANVPAFKFDQFMEHETFCIGLQSKFIDSADRALLLKFAGTVEAGSVSEYGDDGVTQKATIKNGIASKTEAIVPSPATLQPFRTFCEVEQPMSQFIFRMKQDKYSGICCALYEADGGAWKNAAMQSIKAYLQEQLKGIDSLVVIS